MRCIVFNELKSFNIILVSLFRLNSLTFSFQVVTFIFKIEFCGKLPFSEMRPHELDDSNRSIL